MKKRSVSPWKKLCDRAEHCILEVIEALPPALQREAREVPCLLKDQPDAGEDPCLLGVFRSFTPGLVSEAKGPIELYLGNIMDLCEEENLCFENEVRQTYLHELGHHLGLDERDLERLGL